jgi:hypothetical protein
MSNTDRIRNEIIDLLPCIDASPECNNKLGCYECKPIVSLVDQILSIKGLWVESEDQDYPEQTSYSVFMNGDHAYCEAQRDMKADGFIKVEKKS